MGSEDIILVKDLPDISTKKQNKQVFNVYAFGLYLEKFPKGPTCLFVTDFTTNKAITNERFPKDLELCEGYAVRDDQILRIDVFPEHDNVFKKSYERACGGNLISDLDSMLDSNNRRLNVQDKIWLMRITLTLKKYGPTIEARMKYMEHAEPYDTHPNLLKLYRQVAMLPAEFLRCNNQRVRDSIPASHHQFIFNNNSEHFEASMHSPPSADGVTGNVSQSQAAQQRIKQEDYDEFIPDTLFPDDYENSEIALDLEGLQKQSHNSSQKSPVPRSTSRTISIAELNSKNIEEESNRIYTIEGFVVGIMPKDWSYSCVKSYEKDSITNKMELTDPVTREIELIVVDTSIGKNNDTLLCESNSTIIVINEHDIPDFFGWLNVERIYVRCGEKNNDFYDISSYSPVKLDVYSKKIRVSSKVCIHSWCAKGLKFKDIR